MSAQAGPAARTRRRTTLMLTTSEDIGTSRQRACRTALAPSDGRCRPFIAKRSRLRTSETRVGDAYGYVASRDA